MNGGSRPLLLSTGSNKSETLPSFQRAPRQWVLGPDARMFLFQACLGAVSLSLYCVGLNLLDGQQLGSLYLQLWLTHCWYFLGNFGQHNNVFKNSSSHGGLI